jgi:hypothetical protein
VGAISPLGVSVGTIVSVGVAEGVMIGSGVGVDVGLRGSLSIDKGVFVGVDTRRAACLCTNIQALIARSVNTTNKYDFFISLNLAECGQRIVKS